MSITPHKSGGYRVRVYDPSVRRSRHVGYFATMREAKRAEAEAMTAERSPADVVTVAQWREQWLTGAHRIPPMRPWKESTIQSYREQTKRFAEEFGGRRLNGIDVPTALSWLKDRPGDHKVLRVLFADARFVGLLTTGDNPFAALKIPKPLGRKRLPSDFLTEQKIERLVKAGHVEHGDTYGAMIEAFILVAADCALRRGELFALKWESVDLDNRVILVDEAWVERTNDYDTPKGDNVDTVRITERVAEALSQCPRLHPDLVFTSKAGRPLRGSTWSWAFDRVKARAGLSEVSCHWFRHYTATRLVEAGVSFHDTAIHLRHRDGGDLVRNLYAHPDKEPSRDRAVAALDRASSDQLVTKAA
jgi:integrase